MDIKYNELLKSTKSTILLPLWKYFLESNDEKAIKTPMKIAKGNAEKHKELKNSNSQENEKHDSDWCVYWNFENIKYLHPIEICSALDPI